jgi:RHS repeat-associated protein
VDIIDGQPREFLFVPGTFEPLAMLDGTAQPDLYWNDSNGCPVRLIDRSGNTSWAAAFSSWGRLTDLRIAEKNNPIRLQGQYADAETGLHYNTFRYYDPKVGGFISQDPIGLFGGTNPYAYGPNVLTYIDPMGLMCKYMRKRRREIAKLAQTPGNKGIRTALTPRQLRQLGEDFVGEGHTIQRGRHGELWLISADNKRMFRTPTNKSNEFTRTGRQANFHQRTNVNQNWFDEGSVSNVHVDAK